VGLGPRVRDWAVGFGGGEEAHYRGRRLAPHVAVCLLRTRRPTPKEYDPWARAPMPEAGPMLSAEMKRRDGSPLSWRFAFFAHGDRHPRSMTRGPGPPVLEAGPLLSMEMEGRGGSPLAWRFAFFAHGDRHPRSMTRGPEPPCQRLGRLGARRARFSAASWGVNGRVLLKKGFPRVRQSFFSLAAPFRLQVLRALLPS
jgi:hypothetical protein